MRGLTGGAIALFSASYGASTMVTFACAFFRCAATDKDATLLIPVAGPFVQMGVTQSALGNVILAADGLAQGGAVMMFVAARLFPEEVFLVPRGFTVVPVSSRGSPGLTLAGTF
jgi:hypothetical protein